MRNEKLYERARCSKQRLKLIYIDSEGLLSERSIFVRKTSEDKIVGWCCEKQAIRTFKRSNILAVKPYSRRQWEWDNEA